MGMHQRKTTEELRQLAVDIYHGKVFTDRSVPKDDPGLLPMIFLPLAMATPDMVETMKANHASLLYEYMSKAGPRSVNGFPIFMSMNYLTAEENARLATLFTQYEGVQKAFAEQTEGDSHDETSYL